MSRDRRGNGIQEVVSSILIGSTNSNHFRINDLAGSAVPIPFRHQSSSD